RPRTVEAKRVEAERVEAKRVEVSPACATISPRSRDQRVGINGSGGRTRRGEVGIEGLDALTDQRGGHLLAGGRELVEVLLVAGQRLVLALERLEHAALVVEGHRPVEVGRVRSDRGEDLERGLVLALGLERVALALEREEA